MYYFLKEEEIPLFAHYRDVSSVTEYRRGGMTDE